MDGAACRPPVPRPRGTTPSDFCPASFGLDPACPLDPVERARAWASLQLRGLATHTPEQDDVAALTPSCVLGMLMLLEPEVRVDVSSWSGDTVVNQSVAWSSGRTASLTRRRRRLRTADGGLVTEQEPVVEISLSVAGGLLPEIMRALPGEVGADSGDRSPVRVGWPQSAAVAEALRSGRADVATHLSDLPSCALAVLGSGSTTLTGGACITALRRHDDSAHLGYRGVWLWTETDVVELVDATAHGVTLRRTDVARVRSALLTALTGMLHAEEVL